MIFWLFLGVGWVSGGRRLGVGWAAGGGVKTSGCRVCGSLGGSFGFHGRFWGHMGAFLDCSWLSWVHFEIILELFRCNFGIISKAIWDHFGIILGSFWGRSGIIVLSLLSLFQIVLGSFNYFGVILGSFWNHFNIILGLGR